MAMRKRQLPVIALLLCSLACMGLGPVQGGGTSSAAEVIAAREALDSWDWNPEPLRIARSHLDKALAQNSKDLAAQLKMARLDIMMEGGGNERAFARIQGILADHPDYAEAYFLSTSPDVAPGLSL